MFTINLYNILVSEMKMKWKFGVVNLLICHICILDRQYIIHLSTYKKVHCSHISWITFLLTKRRQFTRKFPHQIISQLIFCTESKFIRNYWKKKDYRRIDTVAGDCRKCFKYLSLRSRAIYFLFIIIKKTEVMCDHLNNVNK